MSATINNNEDLMPDLSDERLIIHTVAFVTVLFLLDDEEDAADAEREIAPTIPRYRRLVSDIFGELGPLYTRRAFRMTAPTFYKLHSFLYPFLKRVNPDSTKNHRDGARNGLIPSTTRLGAAIRYLAGGSPYDLSILFGISVREIYNSV